MVVYRKLLSLLIVPRFAVFLTACVSTIACESAEPEVTREVFCDRWAAAACSNEVISVCQAADRASCRATQGESCIDDLPRGFVDRGVDGCIEAVKSAYKDADLTARELDIVVRYGGACTDIFIANDAGERCTDDDDCESALRCVLKDKESGTCQRPVIIKPGFSCSEPDEACEPGFYCDGRNCLAALEEDDDCNNDAQCGPDMYCDGSCHERIDIGDDCKSDSQCSSGICYESFGKRTCVDRIRLSPAEPMCTSLR